jgi:hypothetical protein
MDVTNLNEIGAPQDYDGNIKPYRLETIKPYERFGLAHALKKFYKDYLTQEPGKIVIGTNTIQADPEVLAIMKAILLAGCCKIEERAIACGEVFRRVCTAGTYLDKATILTVLESESTNTFVPVLQETIKEILDGE